MAGPSGGGLEAERVASIVTGALEPAELIDARTGEVTSHPRRFPAFTAADERWRVVHRPAS